MKSTTSARSASPSPKASAFRSTATTRSPSSRARRIARRWCRPAPTKSTVPSISADDANGSGLAARLAAVALSGKRILLTGGAGFIGSALARRLVEDNEVIALDNLHRDAMSGSELAEHPNLIFVHADVLD